MKKAIAIFLALCFAFCCYIFFTSPKTTFFQEELTSYYVPEGNVTVQVPQDYLVIPRNVAKDHFVFSEYGWNYESQMNYMQSNDVMLSIYPFDSSWYEIQVCVSPTSDYDYRSYHKKELKEMFHDYYDSDFWGRSQNTVPNESQLTAEMAFRRIIKTKDTFFALATGEFTTLYEEPYINCIGTTVIGENYVELYVVADKKHVEPYDYAFIEEFARHLKFDDAIMNQPHRYSYTIWDSFVLTLQRYMMGYYPRLQCLFINSILLIYFIVIILKSFKARLRKKECYPLSPDQ